MSSSSGQPFRWDYDGSGRVDAQDIKVLFDSDKNGTLDDAELSVLAQQLTSQIEYNNSLLSHVQSLEQQHLEVQRDVRNKDDIVRAVVAERDSLVAENTDIKKKLKIAQDLADSLSKHSRDYRIEANSFKHEAENAIKECMGMKSLVEKVTSDKNQLQQELTETQNRAKQIIDENASTIHDLASQNDMLRRMNDSLSREVNESREKLASLESERKNLLGHCRELSEAFEELSRHAQQQGDHLALEERGRASVQQQFETLKHRELELEGLLSDTIERATSFQEENTALKDQVKTLEYNLRREKQGMEEDRHRLGTLQSETLELQRDLEMSRKEGEDLKKRLTAETEKWNTHLQKTRDECNQVIFLAKKQAADAIGEAHRQISLATDGQHHAEEQFFRLQDQHNAQVQQCQNVEAQVARHKAAADELRASWDAQTKEFEARLVAAAQATRNAEDAARQERDAGLEERSRLQRQHMERLAAAERWLGEMQGQVKAAKEEAAECRNQQRDLNGVVSITKTKIRQLSERFIKQLQFVKAEFDGVLAKCQEKHAALAAEVEHKNDALKQYEIACEQEKSKCLDLEEQLSRMGHKVSSLESSLLESDYVAQDKVNKCKAVIEQHASDKGMLEGKITRLQQALEATNLQARSVQGSNQSLQVTMEEATKKHAAEKQDFESRLSLLLQQQERLIAEREENVKRQQELHGYIGQLKEEMVRTKEESYRGWQEATRHSKAHEESKEKHMQALQSFGGTTQQLSMQLQQHQELLRVVHTQRDDLYIQNQQLRGDLDKCVAALKQTGVKF